MNRKKMCMKNCCWIVLLLCAFKGRAQLTAFPGAEGFGKYASGGRGGQVAIVTNTADRGEGSFRWALEQFPGEPLTVVFQTGGLIELQSNIVIKRSNLTIAGQTAPGDGICLKNFSLVVNGAAVKGNHGNIIIRHLRSRPGGTDKKGLYGFNLENCHDVIVDHCSFSWANEECAAMYDTRNTTVQWCIVSEGLYSAGHLKGNRSYGGVWGGQYASYHHNLIAHQNNRAIRFNGARAHDTIALVDYRNNVIYNWSSTNAPYGGEVNIPGGLSQVNMVNNYYKPGPAAPAELKFVHASYQKENAQGTGQWYVHGNVMEGDKAMSKRNRLGVDLAEAGFPKGAIADEPFPVAVPLPEESATAAFAKVLVQAGATAPLRDAVDQRVVDETRDCTATGKGVLGKPGIIDLPLMVGGWPVYAPGTPETDTDKDGMPDTWEKEHHLDPLYAADRNQKNAAGYTMLELYLQEKAGPEK